MKTNVNFTVEELLYIEKVFDIQASYQSKNITRLCESFIFSQTFTNQELKNLLSNCITEEAEAQSIVKSIRDKIENLRK